MKAIVFPLLFLGCAVYAQKADSVRERKSAPPALAVKWSPLHLFGYYPTLQLAVEHRIADQFSLQWDAGYVVSVEDPVDQKDGFDKKGFKAKLDIRYYETFGRSAVFFAPEFFYNYVDFKKTGTFGIGCDDPQGGCDYFRYYTYPVRYREPGLAMKVGLFHRFGRHFCIEYHLGVAQRFIRYKAVGVPAKTSYEDEYEDDPFDLIPSHRSANRLSPTTAFRVGYIFR